MTRKKNLKMKGEFDYDYLHDILFFKAKNRAYKQSIEFDNFVVDFDTKNYIVGLQIFDASGFFQIPKISLKFATEWRLKANIEKGKEAETKLEIRLFFRVKMRNKIIQPNPIIRQEVKDGIQTPAPICITT